MPPCMDHGSYQSFISTTVARKLSHVTFTFTNLSLTTLYYRRFVREICCIHHLKKCHIFIYHIFHQQASSACGENFLLSYFPNHIFYFGGGLQRLVGWPSKISTWSKLLGSEALGPKAYPATAFTFKSEALTSSFSFQEEDLYLLPSNNNLFETQFLVCVLHSTLPQVAHYDIHWASP